MLDISLEIRFFFLYLWNQCSRLSVFLLLAAGLERIAIGRSWRVDGEDRIGFIFCQEIMAHVSQWFYCHFDGMPVIYVSIERSGRPRPVKSLAMSACLFVDRRHSLCNGFGSDLFNSNTRTDGNWSVEMQLISGH